MSTTSQPKWTLHCKVGDVNPIDYSGGAVFTDATGVYSPELEWIYADEDEGNLRWIVYRFPLDRCYFTDGVLSDNQYHKNHPVWFADDIESIAENYGFSRDEIIEAICGDDIGQRAHAYLAIFNYHAPENLDSYPLITYSRREITSRVKKWETGRK